nr:MAG TPA: HNH endonuclease [Caudoviricetes sp.]
MDKPTCKVPGCERTVDSWGWCLIHYENWRRHGAPVKTGVYWPDPDIPEDEQCSVPVCKRRKHTRGLCSGHYSRLRKTGDPGTTPIERRATKRQPCKLDGCDELAKGWGYCSAHFQRAKKHGDPEWRLPGEIRDGKKVCPRCGKDKPLSDYGANNGYCLPCAAEWAREKRKLQNLLILQKVCVVCGCAFTEAWENAITCSKKCQVKREKLTLAKGAARRRALLGSCEREDFRYEEIFERDEWTCGICNEPVDPDSEFPDLRSPSLDHVIPLSKGGSHTRDNVQLAHYICNVTKGARLPD